MSVNVDAYTDAVKALGRRLPNDPDLVQDAALFAWEHLDECRGNVGAWMKSVAFQMRRDQRKRLANEIEATARYALDLKSRAASAAPEQEVAVLRRELLPDLGVCLRGDGVHPEQLARARRRVARMLEAA